MSYSFSIKAATKYDAIAMVMTKFDEIIEQQPIHTRDRKAVLTNSRAVIELLADDDTKDIAVSCNGYVSWSSGLTAADAAFSGAAISCSAGYANRE